MPPFSPSGQKRKRSTTHDVVDIIKEMDKEAEERMSMQAERMLQLEQEMEEKRQKREQEQENRMQAMFGNFMTQMMAMCGSMMQIPQPSPYAAQQPFPHPPQTLNPPSQSPSTYTAHPFPQASQPFTPHSQSRPPSPYGSQLPTYPPSPHYSLQPSPYQPPSDNDE